MIRIVWTVVIVFGSLTTSQLAAQPGGGGSPGGGGPPVPISGIEWILGAGALLGAKKLYRNRKRTSN